MRWYLIVCVIAGLCAPAIYAADPNHDTSHHAANGRHELLHGHSIWELGISTGWVHLRQENEDALGVHGHLMRRLGHEGALKYFSLGVGVEGIFATEEHYTFMGTLGIHPWRNLVFAVSPGAQFAKHDGHWKSDYVTHLELKYSFDIGKGFHLGPVIGYSKTKDEDHSMIGLHLGIPLD